MIDLKHDGFSKKSLNVSLTPVHGNVTSARPLSRRLMQILVLHGLLSLFLEKSCLYEFECLEVSEAYQIGFIRCLISRDSGTGEANLLLFWSQQLLQVCCTAQPPITQGKHFSFSINGFCKRQPLT